MAGDLVMLDGVLGEIFFELWKNGEEEANALAYKNHLRRVILEETRGRVDIEMSKKLDEHIAAWWFQDRQEKHHEYNRRQSSASGTYDVSHAASPLYLLFRFLACSLQPICIRSKKLVAM